MSKHLAFMDALKKLSDLYEFYSLWRLYHNGLISIYALLVLIILTEESHDPDAIFVVAQYVLDCTNFRLRAREKTDFALIMERMLFNLNYLEIVLFIETPLHIAPTSRGRECSICMEDRDERFFVKLWCNHEFCLHCIMNHILHKEIPSNMMDYTKYFFGTVFKYESDRVLARHGKEFLKILHRTDDEDKISTYCPYRCRISTENLCDTHSMLFCACDSAEDEKDFMNLANNLILEAYHLKYFSE